MAKLNKRYYFFLIAFVILLASIFFFTSVNVANRTAYAEGEVTISYDANTGSGTIDSTQGQDGVETNLSDGTGFSKTGYTLIGWSETSGENTVDYALGATYTPTVSITFYAVWQINEYTLTYDANGGAESDITVTEDYNTNITLEDSLAFTKAGHTLTGWSDTSGENTVDYALESAYTITEDKTIYAVWQINEYTLTYDANGGAESDITVTEDYNTNITLEDSLAFTKAGHTLTGWSDTSGENTVDYALESAYIITEDKTIYAVWQINEYTLTFEENGGSAVNDITAEFGSTISLPDTSIDYYNFEGWYTDDGTFENQFIDTTMPDENLTLYAKFSPCEYNIYYDFPEGASNHINNPDTYVYGQGVEEFYEATLSYYVFHGWYEGQSGTGSEYTEISETANGDKTLYAYFTERLYTITYDYNGGEGEAYSDNGYNGDYDFLFNGQGVSKEGMTLVGWLDADAIAIYNLGERFYYTEDGNML